MRFLWRPGNKTYKYYAAYNIEKERERGREGETEAEGGRGEEHTQQVSTLKGEAVAMTTTN